MDELYSLRVQALALRLVGFDLWDASGSSDRTHITLLVIGSMLSFSVPLFTSVLRNLTNVTTVSDAMGSLLAVVLTMTKFLVFMYYRGQFVDLINRIRGILDKEIDAWPEAAAIVKTENRSDQSLSLTYMRCYIAACIFAAMKPIVIMVTNKMRTGRTRLEQPHSAVYPWSDQSALLYGPTYMWNVLASYGVVTMSLSMDTLLFAFTYNVCAIFKIAQHRVRHLSPQREAPWQELRELVEVLQLHQTGLQIATQLGHRLRPLVFMQFLVTALLLCFLGFQFADLFPSPVCIYFMFFAGSLLLALFIYSHIGENMKQASGDFAIALYDSNWVDFAPATRRALIVAIMRAQRPCQLQGYFFEPNMATFSAVVRSAISYVMMLRSFNATG